MNQDRPFEKNTQIELFWTDLTHISWSKPLDECILSNFKCLFTLHQNLSNLVMVFFFFFFFFNEAPYTYRQVCTKSINLLTRTSFSMYLILHFIFPKTKQKSGILSPFHLDGLISTIDDQDQASNSGEKKNNLWSQSSSKPNQKKMLFNQI